MTPAPRAPSRRDLAVVAAFVLLSGLCLWGEPWHVDEPFFLAIARQIIRDPLHPLAFPFNWYGWTEPMGAMNNTPPLLPYLLAGALKVSGGAEFATRACFFPFGLAAAWGLLAVAARFLKKPLLPTLIVLAGPAWLIDMNHAMAEVVLAAFALPALWLVVVAVEDRDDRAWLLSAVLTAFALLSKYNAIFLLPAVVLYARARGVAARRLAAWSAVALSGLILALAWSRAAGGEAAHAAWRVTAESGLGSWRELVHRARALLAFAGGLGLVTAAWGFALKPSRRVLLAAAAFAAILFAPLLDLAPLVRPIDRATGTLLVWGLLVGLAALARGPRTRGAALWAAWAGSIAGLQAVYWSVVARFVVFLLPPLVFWLWERLEAERPRALKALGAAGLAAALALGAALSRVDWVYASAQKEAAAAAFARARATGGTVWYSGHWGLQEYLSEGGARQLDLDRGGWSAARPGDVVVDTRANSNRIPPDRPMLADVQSFDVSSAIPLRVLCGWRCEAGFYSSGMGFLPWSLSTEPLDRISFVAPR